MFIDPNIGEKIEIDGDIFVFVETPNAPGIIYAEIGRKAKVYQLTNGNQSYALKAFKPRYRSQHTIQNTPQIAQYQDVPGLLVAKRVVLTPDKYRVVIQEHEAFAYGVLMPWVDGKSWFNYVTGRMPLTRKESLQLARAFVNAVYELETRELAHCDLSSSNFIFSADFSRVELIDIEDLFGYGLLPPDEKPRGTGGYAPGWIKKVGIWEAGADRFATGILISEILGWQYEDIREFSDGDAFFADDEFGNKTKRFRLLGDRLEQIQSEFSRLFKVVWYAESVEECPRIADWKQVLDGIRDPEMVVTPDFLQFGVLDLSSDPPIQPQLTIDIKNSGGGVLEGQAVSNVSWLTVAPAKFTCYEGNSSQHKVVLGVDAPVTKNRIEYSFKDGITIRGNQRSQTLSGSYSIEQYIPKRLKWLVPAIVSLVVIAVLGLVLFVRGSFFTRTWISSQPTAKINLPTTTRLTLADMLTTTITPTISWPTNTITPTGMPRLSKIPTVTRLSTRTKTPTFISVPKVKLLQPANVRKGPGTVYGVLTNYLAGTELTAIGRNQDGTWLVVSLPDNLNGWIATSLVETKMDIMTLPVIRAPSTPTPYPTPIPEQKQPNYPVGDMNHDCVVDDADYEIWWAANGSKIGDPNYNPAADLNSDGVVDGIDYSIWLNHTGEKC